MNYSLKILQFCQSNRVSTTEVADAMGKSGVFANVSPVNHGIFRVGLVKTIFAANNSNYTVHDQIREIQPGEVALILSHNCSERALIGDLISKYVLLYKGAVAIVVQGLVRDAARIRREGYAIWCEGFSPLGCFNNETEKFPEESRKQLQELYNGAIAICDDGGVSIIPRKLHTEEMLSRLQRIEMQEDIWYFCLDTLKWDTKKIVCEKAYLHEKELLSSVHIANLEELQKPLDS